MTLLQVDLRPQSSYVLLIFGIILLVLGVIGTCTGESWERFGQIVYRAKEPKKFWQLIAMDYIMGVCFIGYFLYEVYGHSN